MSEFVPQYYLMDPNTEDLLFDGRRLVDGMVIVAGDPAMRRDIDHPENHDDSERYLVLTRNRWACISNVVMDDRHVVFMATYDDGMKAKIQMAINAPWLVKLATIPPPSPYDGSLFADHSRADRFRIDSTAQFPTPDFGNAETQIHVPVAPSEGWVQRRAELDR